MPTKAKTSRLEARLPEAVYDLLKHAAELQGRSLSDFVVTSAREAAEQAIARSNEIRLSQADQIRFAEAILSPPPIAPALRRAMKARKRLLDER